ncbi:protein ALWAYS EARLY 2 isoform X2 [Ricinus communis]|uniref:protein ALWAYS EARLY 2 isoform X2 n=1 Tax=Ricinus communis TaxID=3988 RepID=UPI00077215C4|nr:protein ALWAYS EARLY 2 isoform X2 [Ricinus communis]|eukprot:XP_015570600.1 protein ALWAYS EARLY 2 isoform X2 [Ricinus communis]
MPPARKKSVNKRSLNDVSPGKAVKNSIKNKEQATGKRRLTDKLGPRWSEAELQRFYKAYRVHGVDWKKVAAEVANRSVEMVHALYKMNKAYLSLPEGTASVVGLIAMMTDHYSTLEVSDSEGESNDVPGMIRRPQKCKRAKVQVSASKEVLLQSHSIASTDGYLSLLKKGTFNGDQPRAVGKRTPRVAISRENFESLKKKDQKSENDDNDDEVAHVAALALTEALQRGSSPQVSRTPHRRTERIESSSVRGWDKMSKSFHMKLHDTSADEEWIECHTRRGAHSGTYARDTSSLADMEGMGTVEVHRKGKKFYGHKVKVEEILNCQSDDGGEACSGTEEGPKVNGIKGKVDIEELNVKIDKSSPQVRKKRRDKHFSGDEFSALDALRTLASLSVMESESSVQLNEERPAVNMDDKCSIPETTSTIHCKDRAKPLRRNQKVLHGLGEVEDTTSRNAKLGRHTTAYAKPVSVANKRPQSISNNTKKRKRSLISKASNAEAPTNSQLSKPLKAETVDEEEIISTLKGKLTCQASAVSEQAKAVGVSVGSFSGDRASSANDVAISTEQVPVASQVTLPTRKTSRRKRDLKRAFNPKDGYSSENILKTRVNRYSISGKDAVLHFKEKLSSCLSSPMVRRWCTFEWFYSAIDYPWFAKREFVEYLNHVGLGHIPRLTRVEWGVIRSSLGKPRRFSEHFLTEEREKLKQYRDSVRKHYTELSTGIREGLPTDLAKPLSVGERVIALHPKTRELYDGSVLTVDHDRCRIQFDCPEVGVEFVKDIDCMPLNPYDNMPEALRRRTFAFISKELQVNGHPTRHLENLQTPANMLVKQVQVRIRMLSNVDTKCLQVKPGSIDIVSAQVAHSQLSAAAQVQANEVDIRALSELNHTLDRKSSFNPGNTLPPWMKPPVDCSFSGVLPSTHHNLVSQESGSTVVEIVRGSRKKAHTMIDAAVQAISSVKEGEDAFVKIEEALDSIDKRQVGSESKLQVIRSSEQGNSILLHNNQLISSTSELQVITNACAPKSHDNSEKTEAVIPSELITSCVAALLMIQTCTERQYPPADVAQLIDSAVTSLHPCCPQNLPIYREIQMCMGRIKTQILALIPT